MSLQPGTGRRPINWRSEPSDPKRTKGYFRCRVSIDGSTHPPPFIMRAGCHNSLEFIVAMCKVRKFSVVNDNLGSVFRSMYGDKILSATFLANINQKAFGISNHSFAYSVLFQSVLFSLISCCFRSTCVLFT